MQKLRRFLESKLITHIIKPGDSIKVKHTYMKKSNYFPAKVTKVFYKDHSWGFSWERSDDQTSGPIMGTMFDTVYSYKNKCFVI